MLDQGGFGRFNMFLFLNNVGAINATGWMLYNLTYLLLYPKYNCEIIQPGGSFLPIKEGTHQYEAYCKPQYFCHHLD
jgi:hypothetical protein